MTTLMIITDLQMMSTLSCSFSRQKCDYSESRHLLTYLLTYIWCFRLRPWSSSRVSLFPHIITSHRRLSYRVRVRHATFFISSLVSLVSSRCQMVAVGGSFFIRKLSLLFSSLPSFFLCCSRWSIAATPHTHLFIRVSNCVCT